MAIESSQQTWSLYRRAAQVLSRLSIFARTAGTSSWAGTPNLVIAMAEHLLNCLLPVPVSCCDISFSLRAHRLSVHVPRWASPSASAGVSSALPANVRGWRMLLRSAPHERVLVWSGPPSVALSFCSGAGTASVSLEASDALWSSDRIWAFLQSADVHISGFDYEITKAAEIFKAVAAHLLVTLSVDLRCGTIVTESCVAGVSDAPCAPLDDCPAYAWLRGLLLQCGGVPDDRVYGIAECNRAASAMTLSGMDHLLSSSRYSMHRPPATGCQVRLA